MARKRLLCLAGILVTASWPGVQAGVEEAEEVGEEGAVVVGQAWPVVCEEGSQLGRERDVVGGWVESLREMAQGAEHLHPGDAQGVGERSGNAHAGERSAGFDVADVAAADAYLESQLPLCHERLEGLQVYQPHVQPGKSASECLERGFCLPRVL